VTRTMHDPMEELRDTLEERFQRHTNELTELTVRSRRSDHGGYDRDTLAALIAASSRGVAESAQALRRTPDSAYAASATAPADRPARAMGPQTSARHPRTCTWDGVVGRRSLRRSRGCRVRSVERARTCNTRRSSTPSTKRLAR
jgi:DnaK suppressor protein